MYTKSDGRKDSSLFFLLNTVHYQLTTAFTPSTPFDLQTMDALDTLQQIQDSQYR
jgi:hypothetical protein